MLSRFKSLSRESLEAGLSLQRETSLQPLRWLKSSQPERLSFGPPWAYCCASASSWRTVARISLGAVFSIRLALSIMAC